MAVDIYKPVTNPVTGESFRCISFDENASVMEWSVNPNGHSAFEHIHYNQDETFTVKLGEARVSVDGKIYIVRPGQVLHISKGTRHFPMNNTNELLVCEIAQRPGLDQNIFLQYFIGLQIDNEYNEKGQVNVAKMGYFIYKTKCKGMAIPASTPMFLFKSIIKFYGFVGFIAGWKKQLKRYID